MRTTHGHAVSSALRSGHSGACARACVRSCKRVCTTTRIHACKRSCMRLCGGNTRTCEQPPAAAGHPLGAKTGDRGRARLSGPLLLQQLGPGRPRPEGRKEGSAVHHRGGPDGRACGRVQADKAGGRVEGLRPPGGRATGGSEGGEGRRKPGRRNPQTGAQVARARRSVFDFAITRGQSRGVDIAPATASLPQEEVASPREPAAQDGRADGPGAPFRAVSGSVFP